uniref:cytochrome c oxidase subunit 3 n=1 Tax=Cyathus pallidus TaxID=380665 RepID=UPI002551E626|nr:cytochrome c oxidase subunit 3 [Cyathus pallidus]WEV87321.1 cytochrome c oxidase subunit 3 [Cyathus pallidus]
MNTKIATFKNILKLQSFPYHLVDQSPWPILLSFSLLNLTVGAVSYMHGYPYGGWTLLVGFVLTVWGMILWFKDVVVEAAYLGHHTKQVQNGIMLGFILFVISEVFAFFSVFWAYFHSSLSPTIELGGIWPPIGILPLDPLAIPLLNTFLLLSSGAFVTYAHHSLIGGKRKLAIEGLIFTVILAIIFTALQYFEYSEASFTFADGVFGSTFYASTGLHGLHVMIGTIFLLVALIRIINYQFSRKHAMGLETSILYWHFVDVVWLFLFISVYFWSAT